MQQISLISNRGLFLTLSACAVGVFARILISCKLFISLGILREARKTKISDFDATVKIYEYVGRLQVTVKDLCLAQEYQGAKSVVKDCGNVLFT